MLRDKTFFELDPPLKNDSLAPAGGSVTANDTQTDWGVVVFVRVFV